jgi:electron-transferring-flavoprotein dehydrogenase
MRARVTVFAEGSHGSLTKAAIKHFHLRDPNKFQTYALGVKEIWEIDPSKHHIGQVVHTIGYPLTNDVYGGGFIYHAENNLVYMGLVVGLNYENPYLSPYQELQRYKLHPYVKNILTNGKCIQYGARTLAQGGIQSLPKLYFPGGLLVGCTAGFLNTAKIKGSHTAMKSGIIAAETIMDAWHSSEEHLNLNDYEDRIKSSWLFEELWSIRNEKPAFKYGFVAGAAHAVIDSIFGGHLPYTLSHKSKPDHLCTKSADTVKPIEYPKPDGVLTFSLLENLNRSGTNHEEDQPAHLIMLDKTVPTKINLPLYGAPEQFYCPANVYEYVDAQVDGPEVNGTGKRLQINAQNCVHCKTCDIKDPTQNINWVPPEGGGGPQYCKT